MRSILGLAALALTATFDFAGASHCKPKEPVTVRNVVSGGNFPRPSTDENVPVPDFGVDGDVKVVTGPGYTGNGSKDKGAVQMQANNRVAPKAKRDLGPYAALFQQLSSLNRATPYTIRFFYAVITGPEINVCQINAFLGSNNFYTDWIVGLGQTIQWTTVLKQVSAEDVNAELRVAINCLVGNVAAIYVDSIFMSNQVTPQNINDFVLDFGDGGDGNTPTQTTLAATTDVTTAGSESSTGPSSHESSTHGDADTTSQGSGTESSEPITTGTQSAEDNTRTQSQATEPTGAETQSSEDNTQSQASETTDTRSDEGTGTETSVPSSDATTSAETTETISPAEPDDPKPLGTRRCANVGSSEIAGRLCGVRPYIKFDSYKILTNGPIQKEECAAACLADDQCKSFSWGTQGCTPQCHLHSIERRQDNTGNLGGGLEAYDRSCAWEIPCPTWPADALCFNRASDTPGSTCQRKGGALKACAKPFVTLTVQPCGGTMTCASLCNQYKGCRSFSQTSLQSTNNCLLFSERSDKILEDGSGTYVQDISCFACGDNMPWATYGTLTNDVYEIPNRMCGGSNAGGSDTDPGGENNSQGASTQHSTTTAAEESRQITSSEPASTTLDESPTTTTEAAQETTCCDLRPREEFGDLLCDSEGTPGRFFGEVERYSKAKSRFPKQNSAEECAIMCMSLDDCLASAYSALLNECSFAKSSLTLDNFDHSEPDGDFVWSTNECWNCKSEACKPRTMTTVLESTTIAADSSATTFTTQARQAGGETF
ncbi:hypothetical protein ACJ41O_001425 [Fusarium nematophilum]